MALPFLAAAAAAPELIRIATDAMPTITRWLAGPEAGRVAQDVAQAVQAVTGTDDPPAALAILSQDPGAMDQFRLELARIDAAHQDERLRQILTDVQDARRMTTEGRGTMVGWGAFVTMIGSMALLAVVLFVAAWIEIPAGNREAFMLLAGGVLAVFTAAANFWVGSSAGSAGKSGLLGAASPGYKG